MRIPERRRELMLRVMDGRSDLAPIMYQFMSLRRCDEVLTWLIKNGITGNNFVSWFKIEGKTPFGAMKLVLEKLNKEAKRPVLVGRDYIPG